MRTLINVNLDRLILNRVIGNVWLQVYVQITLLSLNRLFISTTHKFNENVVMSKL